jgi:voltage-gated sodium channel
MEMFLKLIAVKGDYFNSNWNLFDMFIVLSADIGIVLDLMGLNKNMSTAVTILRAFRILRIVKLLQKLDSIRVIIYAVLNILPSIANVMSLFILALFIFACVGINLFSGVKY